MSLNHIPITINKNRKLKKNIKFEVSNPWNSKSVYTIIWKSPTEVKNGQGDGLTKWKPCFSALKDLESGK